MAKNAYIKCKWSGYDLIVPVIINDYVVDYLKNKPGNGKTTDTLIEGQEFIDSICQTNFWQTSSLPFITNQYMEEHMDEYKQLFPGSIPIASDAFQSGGIVKYNDIEIPTYKLYGGPYQTNATKVSLSTSLTSNTYPFPYIHTWSAGSEGGKNDVRIMLSTSSIVVKSASVKNGELNNLSSDTCIGLFTSIRQYGSGKWESYANGVQLIDFDWWNGRKIDLWPGDPFNPGGDSVTGGGDGDFVNTSTPIEIPELPTVSAASTGFISLFNPTLSQLNELASYLWSDLFEINGWKKLFADPMDAILGLSILPVTIPTSGPREVKVGNIGTGKSLNVASTQFVEVECGTINVNEYWGAYLDYSPYTQCQIYLPYIGIRPISVDEIMGKSVNVRYHVDILTGACCCFIKCGDSVLYTFNGQCSIPIPINSANYTSVINGIISVAASVGSMVATGGASAPLAIPHLASTVANQMKPNIEKSGAISGSGGVLNIQTPYLILTRPRQALPSKQNTFTGYPSFITVTLGELSGYTEVHSIHLENISATADELSEIETLLKGGVIF